MLVSMTGFGRGVRTMDGCSVTVEMKSVNHRYLEPNIRLPKQLFVLEEGVRKRIQQFLNRGRVDVFISVEGEGLVEKELHVDWNLFDQYQQAYQVAEKRLQSTKSIGAYEILRSPEVVSVQEKEARDETFEDMFFEAVDEAIQGLVSMRMQEGNALAIDLEGNIVELENVHQQIVEKSSHISDKLREKYMTRLSDIINGNLDEQRIYTEVAILAEKADIHEEVSRLNSHFEQFRKELKKQEPVGRKLDFIVQEMNREVNTIGSKANDLEITKLVIEGKSRIEKIREQVQNVE